MKYLNQQRKNNNLSSAISEDEKKSVLGDEVLPLPRIPDCRFLLSGRKPFEEPLEVRVVRLVVVLVVVNGGHCVHPKLTNQFL